MAASLITQVMCEISRTCQVSGGLVDRRSKPFAEPEHSSPSGLVFTLSKDYIRRVPQTTLTTPDGWLESLKRSKAQIAAGESVPLLPMLDRIRSEAERLDSDNANSEVRRSARP